MRNLADMVAMGNVEGDLGTGPPLIRLGRVLQRMPVDNVVLKLVASGGERAETQILRAWMNSDLLRENWGPDARWSKWESGHFWTQYDWYEEEGTKGTIHFDGTRRLEAATT